MKKQKKQDHSIPLQTQMSQRKAFRQPLNLNNQSFQIKSDIESRYANESLLEDFQTKSIKSAASRTIYMKKKDSQLQKQINKFQENGLKNKEQKNKIEYDSSYQILDLTFTFITAKLNNVLIGIVFGFLLLVRYYTFGCLLYVMVANYVSHWKWIFIIILNRFLYICIVVKISLKIPQSKTQLILKKNWNCMESEVHQYFQILSAKKLITSLLRGLVPSELSFLYIKSQTRLKMFQIYSTINFIYSSIECIVYYPFFMIYMNYINDNNSYALNIFNINLTIIIALFAQMIMFCLTIYLIGIGIQRRYGSISQAIRHLCSYICCCNSPKKKN